MRMVASAAVGIVRFLYRFIVGDDWTVALAVLLALTATGILAANHISAWWLVPLAAIAMTAVSLRRQSGRRSAA
jgi:hypothetical protein